MTTQTSQQFHNATIRVMDPFKQIKLIEGMVLDDTGLGYWIRTNNSGIPEFRATATHSGIGIGTYSSAKKCERVIKALSRLPINWHFVSYANYREVISGELLEKYLEIVR